ncbi:MAG TPA: hypothetical protein DCP07_04510 [Lachnospiraceae bacterium]|nr:hypothetical protein [Lachnospiraceae bacterium]
MNLMKYFRKKNNDHGFTLVELIVAIGVFAVVMAQVSAIVFNCSRLYTKGVEQVDMQTEAQRVIQLTEELMVDATQSISVNASIAAPGSDDITIRTNTVDGGNYQYDIYLKKASPTDVAGDLYLKKTDIASGSTVADEIMAENVKSISCNMTNYATDDRVTVNVCMQSSGEKYDYDSVAIRDIYLRNDIGSGVKDGDGAEVAGKYKLDVRRYAEYNLSSLYGNEYTYEFEADNNADKVYYTLGADSSLTCKTALNTNPAKKASCVVNAYLKTDVAKTSPEFTIVLITNKVRVGLSDEGNWNGTVIAYGNTVNSCKVTSFADVVGITLNPAYCESKCEFKCDTGDLSISKTSIDEGDEADINVQHRGHELFKTKFKYSYDAQSDAYFTTFSNIFDVTQGKNNGDAYMDYMKDGGSFYALITVGYPSLSSPESKVQIKVYFSTLGGDDKMDSSFFNKAGTF